IPIHGHQLDELAFKIFSKRDICGLQVFAQLVGELARRGKTSYQSTNGGFDNRLRVRKRVDSRRMTLLIEVSFQEPRVFDNDLLSVERVGGVHDGRIAPRPANVGPTKRVTKKATPNTLRSKEFD